MSSAKKKTPSRAARKMRDLKSKKDPQGGKLDVSTPMVTAPSKITSTGWIEVDSFSFGAGRSSSG